MATKPKDKQVARFRFNVPYEDEKVLEWIEHQSNLNFSLRAIIHGQINQDGNADAACLALGQYAPKKRGRIGNEAAKRILTANPPNQDLSQYDQNDTIQAQPIATVVQTVNPVQTPKSNPDPANTFTDSTNINTNINPDENGFVDPDDLFND